MAVSKEQRRRAQNVEDDRDHEQSGKGEKRRRRRGVVVDDDDDDGNARLLARSLAPPYEVRQQASSTVWPAEYQQQSANGGKIRTPNSSAIRVAPRLQVSCLTFLTSEKKRPLSSRSRKIYDCDKFQYKSRVNCSGVEVWNCGSVEVCLRGELITDVILKSSAL